MKALRQRRPVGPHRFQTFKYHALAVAFLNQARVAFFTASIRAADGRHQKTAKV
ncbi:hypothetical protein LTSEMIN_0175, partial [Salmonella enterica subsp. enterica serovar Minnesota str. A4-603]